MVEKDLSIYNGSKTITQVWKQLPKKVMWTTFVTIIDYLEYSGKIRIEKDKTVIWLLDLKKPEEDGGEGMVVV